MFNRVESDRKLKEGEENDPAPAVAPEEESKAPETKQDSGIPPLTAPFLQNIYHLMERDF